MRAAFYTLGCKVNQYETSVLMQQFAQDGFDLVESTEEADVYVLNSCTVTAASDQKCRKMLRRFRRQNPTATVALCGCFPQAFPNAAEQIPEADVLMGSANRASLLAAVKRSLAGEKKIVCITPHEKGESFEPMKIQKFEAHTRAFMKIQDGCQRFCTYCIIPYARGPVRSKGLSEIRQELEGLAQAGHKEVVLVGINLSSYGAENPDSPRLVDAVELACSVEGIQRIRLGSLEPELLTQDDLMRMSRQEKFCPQFHLSLQSGCDSTLLRMRRPYNTEEYREIVRNIRAVFKNSSITTDVMVGFPGETAEEFQQSCDFVEEIGFAKVHVFSYSRRPGTPADRMTDQVEEKEKIKRSKKMQEITQAGTAAFLLTQVGLSEGVLLETQREDGWWHGLSKNDTPIRVWDEQGYQGKISRVKLTKVENQECVAEVVL